MSDEELQRIIASNAEAIQALSISLTQLKQEWQKDRDEWQKDRDEWQKDRRRVFEWMARLAGAEADFYEVQADYLNHVEKIDERLTTLLEKLTPNQDQEE